MYSRRAFIRNSLLAGSSIWLSQFPIDALAAGEVDKLTILHTNDQHSRIEPFPSDGGKHAGLGGFSQRAALISRIRAAEKNVLLLDAGDIFQGTPYFNYFAGELEFKLMNEMGYDAATIGNHDFDAGLEGLNKQLPNATFEILNANYDFSDTVLAGKIDNFHIFKRGVLKIGVFGVGIELDGLVPKNLIGNTQYDDPISITNDIAGRLKHDHNCDLVVCLSHLGYKYNSQKLSDVLLAKNSSDVDIIIGGHTHTFLEIPDTVQNSQNRPVLVNQVGWAGLYLGRIDVYFDRKKRKKRFNSSPLIIGKKTSEN